MLANGITGFRQMSGSDRLLRQLSPLELARGGTVQGCVLTTLNEGRPQKCPCVNATVWQLVRQL